jgi:hypothetical protein
MMHDVELLQYIYKTADMGCEGIQSVIDRISGDPLKNDLKVQHDEYMNIRSEAQSMLQSRNEQPKGVGTMAKMSAEIMSAGKCWSTIRIPRLPK